MSQPVAFTDVPSVKAYLRIPITNTGDDGLLRSLVDGANAAVARSLLRNVLSATYTEVRNGTGTRTLVLKNFPVSAVTSVTIKQPFLQVGAPPPAVVLVQGVDYTFTQYSLKLYSGVWTPGVANVSVTYTAGYALIPGDLAHAAAKVAAIRYNELGRLGQKSKTIAGEIIAFDLAEFPPDVEAILARYRGAMANVDQLAGTT